jgi:uncharacterized membrane protein YidH (DUF202 family)
MRAAVRRAACWLAGAWAGLIAGIGLVVAPTLFATLARADAGRAAAQLFRVDATIGICVGAVLLVLCLQLARTDAARGASSRFSIEMVLALVALFAIVAGHYAIEPMIESVRRGEDGPSFAVLHGVASAFFLAKLVAVSALAWRLTRIPGGPANDAATAAGPTS